MLRPANDSDSDHIRMWRNHPQVRSVSRTTHEITPAEHAAWFANRIDPSREILVYEYAGRPAGVVNFTGIDADRRHATLGFYLDVAGLEARGEMLPAWLDVQRESVAYAFDRLGLDLVVGEVLEGNAAVRQMNRRLGFVEGEPVVSVVGDVNVRFYPITLSRATHDARSRARKS